MSTDITTITFPAGDLKAESPENNTDVANKEYVDNEINVVSELNRIYFNSVNEAVSFNYDTLKNPFEQKFVHINQGGQGDRNFYIYYPAFNPNIPDSPLVKTTTGTSNPGALIRVDVVKRTANSQQLSDFVSFSGGLPNNWHIEPQSDDNSLQLLWQGIKWPVLIKNSTNNTVDANSSRIINVNTPTSDNDASTKSYVDDQISGIVQSSVFPIWAEENGDFSTNNSGYQWSFGNGVVTQVDAGITLAYDCQLIALSIRVDASSSSGSATVKAVRNGDTISQGVSVSPGNDSSVVILTSPESFTSGQRLNFRTTSTSGTVSIGVVTAWFKMNNPT